MSPNNKNIRAIQFRVWQMLTPDWNDFHEFVGKVPHFSLPPKPRAFKYDPMDEGCQCAVLGSMAPCVFCTSLSEEEADVLGSGGMRALLEFRASKD